MNNKIADRKLSDSHPLNFLIVVPRFVEQLGQYYIFPLGLAYISASLKKHGIQVVAVNLNHHSGTVADILSGYIVRHSIDVICTGGLSVHYQQIKDIIGAAHAENANVISILGGGILSSEPEMIMGALQVTYGVIGEGEETIVELARFLQYGGDIQTVPGIIYRNSSEELVRTSERAPIMDLDSLVYPDYEGLGFAEYLKHIIPSDERELAIVDNPRPISIISSRSCPYSCTFCYHPLGKKYRQRSLENFFAELDHWIKTYNCNIVFIMDELFSLSQERIFEFCSRIKKYNVYWIVQLTVRGVSKTVLDVMRDAGCFIISYGLESGSDEILKSMKKPIAKCDIEKCMNITYASRLGVQANFIFGDIRETYNTIVDTLKLWINIHKKHCVYLIPIEVYPGSDIYNNACDNNIIQNKLLYIESGCPSLNLTSMPDNFYLRSLLLIYLLRKSYQAIPAKLISRVAHGYHPLKGQLYSSSVICPHCFGVVSYHNMAAFDVFMTSCRLCYRRFDVFSSNEYEGLYRKMKMAFNLASVEERISEIKAFLQESNYRWLVARDLKLEGCDTSFMAIKLFNIMYVLPQEFSADDIRWHRLPLYMCQGDSIIKMLHI